MTDSTIEPKFADNVPDGLVVREAFAAATGLKDAVRLAVDNEFKNTGDYEETSPFDLPPPAYMALMIGAMFSFGFAYVMYCGLSAESNARRDDYRREPQRHFETMHQKLKGLAKQLPEEERKRLLEIFARQAAFTFHMEKAAVLATRSDTFKKGLKEVRGAGRFADDAAGLKLLEGAYREGRFPKPHSFLDKLDASFVPLGARFGGGDAAGGVNIPARTTDEGRSARPDPPLGLGRNELV